MTDHVQLGTTRRAALAGAAGLASMTAFGWRRAAAQVPELTMWWWGEQELPGLQAFVDESIAGYSAARVRSMLQDTAVVISQFQTAAAAGEAPDIQFLWNGIYHMESVWLGYLRPLDGLVAADVITASNPTLLSRFDGHVWRLGWYALPMIWIYNKDAYDKAGLDADSPPRTWDELLAACEKLKASGVSPVGGGIQDGYWGEWYVGQALAQCVDSAGEVVDLFTGARDFRDPRYHEPWTRLAELKKAGFLNPEISSTELYPGIDLIVAGKVATGLSIGSRMPADSKATGGRIGAFVMPSWSTTKLAGKPIMDAQGLGIPAGAKNPEAAARFLEYLQSPERLRALHAKTGWIPANTNFDASVLADASVKAMWQAWTENGNVPYLANLVPGQWYEQALLPAGQKVVAGEMSGEEAGELAASVAEEWRNFNPDIVEKYKTWAADLA